MKARIDGVGDGVGDGIKADLNLNLLKRIYLRLGWPFLKGKVVDGCMEKIAKALQGQRL